VVPLHRVALLRSLGRARLLDEVLHILRALLPLQLQRTLQGQFDVRLALARLYALDGQFSTAQAELQAARSLNLQSDAASKALQKTAEYLREPEKRK
jgi:hypothetical protein